MAQAKHRGRPFKVTSADSADNVRRERMRLSQQAFRQRREAETKDLKERVRLLEDLVGGMSEIFMSMSDLAMQPGVSSQQPGAAHQAKDLTKRFLDLAKKLEPNEHAGEEPEPMEKPEKIRLPATNLKRSTPGSPRLRNTPALATRPLSPYLSYSMLSSSVRSGPHMADVFAISHCLGTGQDCFLARLYWYTTYSTYRSFHGDRPERLQQKFRLSVRHEEPHIVKNRVYETLQYIIHGNNYSRNPYQKISMSSPKRQSPWPAPTLDSPALTRLNAAIIAGVLAERGTMDDFLTPYDAERYLRDQWGLDPGTDTLRLKTPLYGASETSEPEFTWPQEPLDSVFTADDAMWQAIDQDGLDEPWLAKRDTVQGGGEMSMPSFPSSTSSIHEHVSNQYNHGHLSQIPAPPVKEITTGIETLLEGLSLAAVCFGTEMRLDRQGVDQAAQAAIQLAVSS